MKVLLIGSGGREHALAKKIVASDLVTTLYCQGNNPGINNLSKVYSISPDLTSPDELVAFAQEMNVDLTVVGPEQPLVNGIVDVFKGAGQAIFGPTRAAALLESSKKFAKDIMDAAGVPTAPAKIYTNLTAILQALSQRAEGPVVVKYDGLAGGKGVTVCQTKDEAVTAVRALYADESDAKVLLEEFLIPQPGLSRAEFSVFAVIDEHGNFKLFDAAQDYKAALDGDKGPNTGGMGAYSPVSFADDDLMQMVADTIVAPIIKQMQRNGTPYAGVLYAGLMLTVSGLAVVEFNCRFGDPECQVLMERLESDIVPMLKAVADGESIADMELRFCAEACVGVVVANTGYPGDSVGVIPLPDCLTTLPGVYHAGTTIDGNGVYQATGGRVCMMTAKGTTLAGANRLVYELIGQLPETLRMRKDIAA